MKTMHLELAGEVIELDYRIEGNMLRLRRKGADAELVFEVEDLGCELILRAPGLRRRIAALREADRVHLADAGEPFVLRRHVPDPADAGGDASSANLEAPMTGKVVKVLAEAGARIREGDAVIIVEAMKMEHKLVAPFDAVVESISAVEGQQVDMNERLAHLVRVEDEGAPAS
ncbi:MAG: hypothetical protein H6807_00645 [Planctomycetes bacterium]|nr:hypothetical protein [Planctomycetota bacterium]